MSCCRSYPIRAHLSRAVILMALGAPPVSAQSKAYSIDDVITMLTGGVTLPRIETLAQTDCVTFSVNSEARDRLQKAGANASLLEVLGRACYLGPILNVQTNPAGVEVWLNGNRLGTTPVEMRVGAASAAAVELRSGSWRMAIATNLAPGTRLRIVAEGPQDSVTVPEVPNDMTIAENLRLFEQWKPTNSRPIPPAAPTHSSTYAPILSLLGLGGGVAIGVLAPVPLPTGCYKKGSACDNSAGTQALLGGLLGSLFAIGGAFLGSSIDNGRFHGATEAHTHAMTASSARLDAWEHEQAASRERWLQTDPIASQRLALERTRLKSERDGAIAENNMRIRHNASLPEPKVTTELLVRQ